MMKNMGNAERVIRIVIGAVIIGWGIYARNWWGAVGLLPLVTGLVGFCGLYAVVGKYCPCCRNDAGQGGGCCSKPGK